MNLPLSQDTRTSIQKDMIDLSVHVDDFWNDFCAAGNEAGLVLAKDIDTTQVKQLLKLFSLYVAHCTTLPVNITIIPETGEAELMMHDHTQGRRVEYTIPASGPMRTTFQDKHTIETVEE